MSDVQVEVLPLEELHPDPHNANKGTERGTMLLDESLEEFGAGRSVLVDRNRTLIAGNKTHQSAMGRGFKDAVIVHTTGNQLVVVQRDDLDLEKDAKARRLALMDNRAGEANLEWDVAMLAQLKESEPEIVEGLWTEKELRILLSQIEPVVDADSDPGAKEDKAEELRVKWGVNPGQLWEIPSQRTPKKAHRLMCGDSTNLEHVARLMNGQRAVLFATDPPYLVEYTGDDHPGGGKDWSSHYFDEDKSAEGEGGLYDGFISAALKIAITEDAIWYCWHASRRQMMVEQAWIKHGVLPHQQIIWKKDRPILTYSWYMWQHEPCLMGWVKGHKPNRITKDIISGVWEYPSPAGEDRVEHPTQKPIEVFIIPILQHTKPGDLCYEPFSGSGTQLAAAESTGRICFALEKSPAFVAVALERLAGLGLSPRKVEGG